MKENPPTLMIRTDLLSNDDIRVTTPGRDYLPLVWERPEGVNHMEAHRTAAKVFASQLRKVDADKVMKGTGPGHRMFMYHFAKVNQ